MRKQLLSATALICAIVAVSSCKKDEKNNDPAVKAYTVPTTYNFSNTNILKANQAVKMTIEVDAYLKLANTGASVVALDQSKVNNMFANTGNPFTDATLNVAGFNITGLTADAYLFKSFADSVLMFNTGATASAGVGGFVPRSANKIVVGPNGLEYGQAFTKGVMGALLFKEAVNILTNIKSMSVSDTTAAQARWDAAFGYLSVPVDYDTAKTYASTDPTKPLLWGGYLAERGKTIQAGGTIFNAFLKGRAAIGGYDKATRDAQIDIILAKWEQLAAAAALNYVTSPTLSSSIGNYGSQLHGLSEGYGFILSLKYRASNSKLSAANFEKLKAIIRTDFYTLLQSPFTELKEAQNILKTTYDLQ